LAQAICPWTLLLRSPLEQTRPSPCAMATQSMTNALFTVMDTRRDGVLSRDEFNQMAFTAIHNNPLSQPKNFAVAPPGVPSGVTYTTPWAASAQAPAMLAPGGFAQAPCAVAQPINFGAPAMTPHSIAAPVPAVPHNTAALAMTYTAAAPALGATLQPSVSWASQSTATLQPSVSWTSQPVAYAAPALQPSVSWAFPGAVTYAAPAPVLQQSVSMAEPSIACAQHAPTYFASAQSFGAPTVTYAAPTAAAPMAYATAAPTTAPMAYATVAPTTAPMACTTTMAYE